MYRTSFMALVPWHTTDNYRAAYQTAEERLAGITERLRARGAQAGYGPFKFNGQCEPEVWINASHGYRYKWDAPAALASALKHGETGYWSFDDLEAFANGGGMIVRSAMWRLGFRHGKRNPTSWVRHGKDERDTYAEQQWRKKHAKSYSDLPPYEVRRLASLQTVPQGKMEMGRSFSLRANKGGLVYLALQVDPFAGCERAESVGAMGDQMRQRGHLAREQRGFLLEAANVHLGNHDALYLKCVQPDCTYTEFVWPSITTGDGLTTLLEDLEKRALPVMAP